MEIRIIQRKITLQELKQIAQMNYGHMTKGVVDISRNIMALGGEMHSDAENRLLENGSQQKDLWGFNIYIDRPAEKRLEYTSLINIRPNDQNFKMEIQSPQIKEQVHQLVNRLIEA